MRSRGEGQLGQGRAFDLCSKWHEETLVGLPQFRIFWFCPRNPPQQVTVVVLAYLSAG